MQPDIEKYRKYVDAFDLTETEKVELIHTLWQIMQGFVDRAFGRDSTQLALAAGQRANSKRTALKIEYEAPLGDEFERSAVSADSAPDSDNA